MAARHSLFLGALVLGLGCSSSDATSGLPSRECGLKIWHQPASAASFVEVVGDWDGWQRPGRSMVEQPGGWRVLAVDVPPGEHAYAIIEDGVWLTDRAQPLTGNYEEHEVSVAIAADCEKPALRVDGVETSGGKATVHATFLSGRHGGPVDNVTVKDRLGSSVAVTSVDPDTGAIVLEATNLKRGKYTYTIEATDTSGQAAEDARATVWAGSASDWDPRDAIVYQVVLDRFRGDGGAPLAAPATPSARAGGTLAGVRASLDAIQALGATAIWLSPLYENPTGDFTGTDGRKYTSYHGYWPIASRALDARFATEAELQQFVDEVHSRGMRILFDVVPNHVHEQHAWTKEHRDWFKSDCVCGQGKCDWGEHIKTCWFAPYLPDLDWTIPAASVAATEDVLWWFDRWDADGVRIDAVPMMPRAATRRIATSVRRRYAHPGNALYVIGENFTGPGGFQSLRYDLGPYGLDGSFHFPLMWTLREAIANEAQPLSAIDETFKTGEKEFAGSGAVMGLMVGNHDVARFASVAAGNDGGDTWAGPAQPTDAIVYAKQRLALAAVLTLPGAPVIYYGDEVGLAGRSDPDCRRVMPADDALNEDQIATRTLTRKLGKARAGSRALRRGARKTLLADAERYVFTRTIDGETAIITLARRPTAAREVAIPAGNYVDVLTGTKATGSVSVGTTPFEIHVYLPENK